ncbi:MAG: EAL domain-containing protein [Lachnospiraceae bacterium]|nr:EAL domain-containing protein [Lachnospiraceae bacterium]
MGTFVEQRLNLKRKVLVVDDELINRKLLSQIIGRDYEVLLAENGRKALRIIREHQETLSLILLDLLMPEMDGYELLEIIHNDLELSRIPVIVLTAEKSAEVKSLQMGAADFIPKPYDAPEVILARIGRTIELFDSNTIISATEFDSVTKLFNREFFMEYAYLHDQYYPDFEMDAYVLDINRFHLLNEMYGRAFGNDVLCHVAARLKELVKERHGVACRDSADVFFFYLPHTETPDEVYQYIEYSIRDLWQDARSHIRLGIYPKVDRSLDMNRRFDCALLACNSIRHNFTSHIAFYDAEMHEKEAFGERLISEMDTALQEKQFLVYYQPKFDITGDEPVLASAEALIRWQHPSLGMISPGQFIPLFEENGLINKLDRYVWYEAAAQIRKWRDKYGVTVPVSVNVSRIDICEPDFVYEIKRIVKDNGLRPQDYYLEVTESAYTENSDQIIEVVNELREYGFRIEMDDFGTGYSSLNMLTDLPIDVLKLDMKFVRNMHTNEKDYRIVQLIMDIAEFLDVTVVAEGVEFEEQYKLLKEADCDVIQGFYFSKPVPPEELEKFIVKED